MKKKLISLLLVGVMVLSNASIAFATENNANQDNQIATVDNTVTYPTASGADALADTANGVILDVRSAENYADYHVANSISMPLFGDDGSLSADSELATAFSQYAASEEGHSKLDGKNVYILCNSGKRGAQLATELLVGAQYDNAKLFTITNGAKDLAILHACIGESWATEGVTVNPLRKTGAEAVAAVENDNVIILDVRAAEVREMNGHLTGSISQPLFTWDGKNHGVDVFDSEDSLVAAFTKFAADNKGAYTGKDIYILCNGGQSGARAALKLLLNAGYNFDNLYTVTGGAGDADVKAALTYDYNFASGKEALAAQKEGAVILDVRSAENYADYHVADSLSQPLFTDAGPISTGADDLATAFTTFVKDNTELAGKKIYIVCNSGARGAQLATKLLMQTGQYDLANIFTITNGAKDLSLVDAAIGSSWATEGVTVNPLRKTGTEAVAAIGNDNVIILDVRAAEVREMNGHLTGSISQPLFTWDGKNHGVDVFDSEDSLVAAFTKFAADNKEAYKGKDIYILCNGGQSGARAALKLLLNAGYNFDNLYTVTGGAGDADVKAALTYDYNFASGEEALAAQKEGAVILDVRSAENNDDYSIAGSISQPLFTDAGPISSGTDELATAFTDFVKDNEDLAGKDIYILCNSGSRGAQLATKLLMQTGQYDLANIYTITGGAKDLAILDAGIGNDKATWDNEYPNFVSGKDAVDALDNKDIVILDVRATEVRNANGELKGSIAQPLFNYVDGKNKVTTLYDDLAANFTAFVKGNKDLAGKQIYILCNGGQSGARAALKLLINAGYSYDDIKVIKGGAGDADVKAALTPVNTTGTVQTGDTATFIPYILTMGVALVAIVVTSKKKFAK